jgi:hypothetical protein
MQQVNDGIATRRIEGGWQVDESRPRSPSECSGQKLAAIWLISDRTKAGDDERGDEGGKNLDVFSKIPG